MKHLQIFQDYLEEKLLNKVNLCLSSLLKFSDWFCRLRHIVFYGMCCTMRFFRNINFSADPLRSWIFLSLSHRNACPFVVPEKLHSYNVLTRTQKSNITMGSGFSLYIIFLGYGNSLEILLGKYFYNSRRLVFHFNLIYTIENLFLE